MRLGPVAEGDTHFADIILGNRLPVLPAEPLVQIGGAELGQRFAGMGFGQTTELALDVLHVVGRHAHFATPLGEVRDKIDEGLDLRFRRVERQKEINRAGQ